jgi:hypothetical protein
METALPTATAAVAAVAAARFASRFRFAAVTELGSTSLATNDQPYAPAPTNG